MSKEALELLAEHLGDGVLETHAHRGDDTAVVQASVLVDACRWLRDHQTLRFDMLCDMTAVDYLPREPRFEVVYHLLSVQSHKRLRLKVELSDRDHDGNPIATPEMDTLSGVYPIADWLEREIWDMYGIRFRGHPDPRRILLYEEFVGHPLRKDYPKDKAQPLVRRPENEIAEVLARKGEGRFKIPNYRTGDDS